MEGWMDGSVCIYIYMYVCIICDIYIYIYLCIYIHTHILLLTIAIYQSITCPLAFFGCFCKLGSELRLPSSFPALTLDIGF